MGHNSMLMSMLALALMFLKILDWITFVASRLCTPCTCFDLKYLRPDFIILFVIARKLVTWRVFHGKIGYSPRFTELSKMVSGTLEMTWVMQMKWMLKQLFKHMSISWEDRVFLLGKGKFMTCQMKEAVM